MYKYICPLSAIPYLSMNVANIIKSLFGKNKKLLALDLDNTLWGGVVGGIIGAIAGFKIHFKTQRQYQEIIDNIEELTEE